MQELFDALDQTTQMLESNIAEAQSSHQSFNEQRRAVQQERDRQQNHFLQLIAELSSSNERLSTQPSPLIELRGTLIQLQSETSNLREQVDSLLEDDDLMRRRSSEAIRQLEQRQQQLHSEFDSARHQYDDAEQRKRLLNTIASIRWTGERQGGRCRDKLF